MQILKQNKKILICIAIYVVAILATAFFACTSSPSYSEIVPSTAYQIDKMAVVADINEDGSIKISESITATFQEDAGKHGIFRYLPLTAKVGETDENGNVNYKNFRYNYSNISSNIQCSQYNQDGNLILQLGNRYRYVDGETVVYNISYTISYNGDQDASKDSFYYNLIGNGWDTKILESEITVNFPKQVESTPVLYYGEYGSTNSYIDPAFDGRTLHYTHSSTLAAGESLTIKVDLEEGYFKYNIDYKWDIIITISIIACVIIAILSFWKLSNKTPLTPVVQFDLDKKYTSADAGYLIDLKVQNKDIASLIIFWAQHGYLAIKEENKVTTLIKKKDIDEGMKPYEKIIFKRIFDESDEIELKSVGAKIVNEVSIASDDLVAGNSKSFNKKAEFWRTALCFLSSLVFAVAGYKVAYTAVSIAFMPLSILGGLIAFLFLSSLANKNDVLSTESGGAKAVRTLWTIGLFTIIILSFIFCYSIYADPFGGYIISIFLLSLTSFIVLKFDIRTEEGINALNDIVGLKNFIEVTEKDRLEMLVKDNPELFYDVLPYAYVFGIYDKWCKKFEGIVINSPSWYSSSSYSVFDYYITTSLLRSTMVSFSNEISSAITMKLASSAAKVTGKIGKGFSGRSGGGFSGGGHGGGGGGSW